MRRARWWDRSAYLYDSSLDRELPITPHQELVRISTALWEYQGRERQQMAEDAVTLYYGNQRHSVRGYRNQASFGGPQTLEPPGYNVIQACVDTKTAHIVRNKVRPLFLTEAGDWALQEKAKGMQRAVEAVFQECGLYSDVGMAVCRDGNMFDCGAVKWCVDYANNRIIGERVFGHELLIPEREARLGKPRQMGHMMLIDRDVLADQFKDDADAVKAIHDAPPASYDMLDADAGNPGEVADMVLAYEWWHLPSGRVDRSEKASFGINADGEFEPELDPGHDGRHSIVIDGFTLLDEPWPFEYFPISFFLPQPNAEGAWSRGIPETLAGAQIEINKMNQRVQGMMNLHAVTRLLIWRQAKINKAKVTNDWASILETSVPPEQAVKQLTPSSVPADFLNRIDRLISWAEKQVGISELSIAAQKPAGVDHAPGMQHLADTESIRHTPAFRAWEEFFLHGSRCVVDGLRLLAERNKNFEIVFGDAKDLKRIKWREVDLGEEKHHLKVWPTNLLPQTPAAKASMVMDLLGAGMITREEALALIDYPDIEAIKGDATAELENIEHKLDRASKGDALAATPHPYLNLPLAMSIAKQRINRMEANGIPDESIDPIRRFWEDCQQLQLQATAEAAAAAQGVPPPGAPTMPQPPDGPPGMPMPMGPPGMPPGPPGMPPMMPPIQEAA